MSSEKPRFNFDALLESGVISSFQVEDLDANGNVGPPTPQGCNREQLTITFPNGQRLVLSTWCSGVLENTGFFIGEAGQTREQAQERVINPELNVDFGKAKGKPVKMSFDKFKSNFLRIAKQQKITYLAPGGDFLYSLWEGKHQQAWTLLEIIEMVREHCTLEASRKRHAGE
jgi:hypothetical protein